MVFRAVVIDFALFADMQIVFSTLHYITIQFRFISDVDNRTFAFQEQ